ncbi:MAG: hypothetical protein AB8V46_04495 [Candidatus Midichloria sp.]
MAIPPIVVVIVNLAKDKQIKEASTGGFFKESSYGLSKLIQHFFLLQ